VSARGVAGRGRPDFGSGRPRASAGGSLRSMALLLIVVGGLIAWIARLPADPGAAPADAPAEVLLLPVDINAAPAASLAALDIPSFACTPDQFPDLMAAALRGDDIGVWAAAQAPDA